ncbi:MAG: hypothetical protein ACKVW3_03880 [Phycisphaerales bacterium]
MRMLGTLTAMAGIAVGLGGCSAGMGRYDVRVMPSDQLKNAGSGVSLKMDLVGVSDFEKVKYESMPIDEYLTAPSGQAYSMVFSGKDMKEQVLSKNDKIWGVWSEAKARWLFMFVDFPPEAGAARREAIPIRADRWDKTTIEVQLNPRSIRVITQPKPDKE